MIGKKVYILKQKRKEIRGSRLRSLQNYLMLPIYSSSLIIALDKNEIKGMQYLPIKVINFNGDCLKGFSITYLILLKLLTKKSLILTDLARIFRTRMLGKIGVKKFVLKRKNLEGYDIIRLKEYKQRFFVSQKFKDIFEENGFTGYSFIEVELE